MAQVRGQGNPISAVAGGDLTSSQYRAVKMNTSGEVIAIAAITDIPVGILQNAPNTGEVARFIPIGGGASACELGATLNPGVRVAVGSTGKIVAAAATSFPIGVLITGGADTEVGEILLASLTVQA